MERDADSLAAAEQFQVVVCIFCIEYASENYDEYRNALRNAVSLIEPSGFLVNFIEK